MGGFNSGRHGGKRTTADMRALDIRKIQRDGLLNPGRSFGWTWKRGGETVARINLAVGLGCVTLEYRNRPNGGQWQDMKYPVRLTDTACHYGGQRAWWLCPAVGCGRRVAVLYGGAVLRAGSASAWPTQASVKPRTTGHAGGQTNCATAWAGRQAF
jgi:hypothetical protein